MSQTTEAVIEFSHDGRGLLVAIGTDDGGRHQAVLVPRGSVTPECRMALANFVQSLAEVQGIDEVALNEKVVSTENCTIVLDSGNGLPTPIRRGQRIDDRATIEALLRSGARLLHDSPEASAIAGETLLEAAVADQKYRGMAMNVLVARRAAAAV